ncbi:MAG: hydrogenase maturation nickel metallochaperone HypA [Chloroflexota bacterium]
MHELSIAVGLLTTITERLDHRPSARVVAVHLRVGPLSGVVIEALRTAFEVVAVGTIAEGAALHVVKPPVVVRCRACGHEHQIGGGEQSEAIDIWEAFWPLEFPAACSACGGSALQVVQGRELELVAVEVTDERRSHPDRRTAAELE